MQELAAGDQAAFAALFTLHRAPLYDYLEDINNTREIAEELLVFIFLKLWLGRELAPQL